MCIYLCILYLAHCMCVLCKYQFGYTYTLSKWSPQRWHQTTTLGPRKSEIYDMVRHRQGRGTHLCSHLPCTMYQHVVGWVLWLGRHRQMQIAPSLAWCNGRNEERWHMLQHLWGRLCLFIPAPSFAHATYFCYSSRKTWPVLSKHFLWLSASHVFIYQKHDKRK